LIEEGKGGRLQSANDINGFSDAIRSLANDADLRRRMGTVNSVVVIEFDLAIVTIQMLEIYRDSGK
jgi:glycosyltransferase involved in cell wall biosynthesis